MKAKYCDSLWIGAEYNGAAWVGQDGKALNYFNWQSNMNQPDNPSAQKCVMLRKSDPTGGWNDFDCAASGNIDCTLCMSVVTGTESYCQ